MARYGPFATFGHYEFGPTRTTKITLACFVGQGTILGKKYILIIPNTSMSVNGITSVYNTTHRIMIQSEFILASGSLIIQKLSHCLAHYC